MSVKFKPWLTAVVILMIGLVPLSAAASVFGNTVTTSGDAFTVEVDEGKLLRLNADAASVFIANPAIADISVKSSRLVYILGLAPGETSLFVVDKAENVIANTKVVVRHNISRLQEAIDTLLPTSNVNAVSIDGGIILTGSAGTATDAENANRLATRFLRGGEVINQIKLTAPNQVNLKVRIAEVSREIANELGFNWDVLFNDGDIFIEAFTNFPIGINTNPVFGFGSPGNFDITGLMNILETDGYVSILAEPNLTALSGETASFLAGGEFPIPVAQSAPDDTGTVTITVEFKKFGVSLSFTPTIIGDNRISLLVAPEVSEISPDTSVSFENISIPGLLTRRAKTTVEVGSGQSFAIAGLLQDDARHQILKYPGLADIPILGALFRSDSYERNETELVIIVTPHIVEPVDHELITPITPGQVVETREGGSIPVAGGSSTSRMFPLGDMNPSTADGSGQVGFIME
jgi:pilus assembly protein CpaC